MELYHFPGGHRSGIWDAKRHWRRIGRVEAIKHSDNDKTAGPRILVCGVDASNPDKPKLCGLRYLRHPERALILLHHMVPASIRQAFKAA